MFRKSADHPSLAREKSSRGAWDGKLMAKGPRAEGGKGLSGRLAVTHTVLKRGEGREGRSETSKYTQEDKSFGRESVLQALTCVRKREGVKTGRMEPNVSTEGLH